jgi:hypothetical protein
MLRSIIGLALAGAFVAVGLVPAAAQSAPSGSYLQTCSDVRVFGNRLEARCTNSAGAVVSSRLDLNSCQNADIANVEGTLRCVSYDLPPGPYQQSCDGVAMQGQTLYAVCRNASGVPQRTSLDLNSCRGGTLSNVNGNLRCMESLDTGNSSDLPDGPFLQSCSGSYMQGSMLNAYCRTQSGATVRSSIDVSQCNNTVIANIDGNLRCIQNRADAANTGPAISTVPGGSYQQTCNSTAFQGSMLSATCSTPNGQPITSSLDLSSCQANSDIVNSNGRLECRYYR